MIIKTYEIKKKNLEFLNLFLVYGENIGLKQDITQSLLEIKQNKNEEYKKFEFEEEEIINNESNFYNLIFSGSLFDEKKIIIVNRSSDKIIELIDEISKKKINSTIIIFKASQLEKKSKIRNLFEKNKNLGCFACYLDSIFDLRKILNDKLLLSKIKLSGESISLLIERSMGDRINLSNEINKIKSLSLSKKTISHEDIKELTNVASNYQNDYIVNACLNGNKKNLNKTLNENNFLIEDFFILLKIFSKKVHRLLAIKKLTLKEKNLEKVFTQIKPPIFWKEKDDVKKQINLWNEKKLSLTIKKINEVELNCKKNSSIAINIMLNFLSGICEEVNNYS